MDFVGRLSSDAAALRTTLRAEENFDITERALEIAGRKASLFFISGLTNNYQLEAVLSALLRLRPEALDGVSGAQDVLARLITFSESSVQTSLQTACTLLIKGNTLLVIDGITGVLAIDVRFVPQRSVQEPQRDKTLRGARDGFTETLIVNTALLRRRIRDERFTIERFSVGESSRTDVALCSFAGRCDRKLLDRIRKKLQTLPAGALSATVEGLSERLFKSRWFDPFPRLLVTERPDTAAAALLEGKILLLMDTSPSAIILPAGFFDFMSEANDFYFKPIVASYLRIVRLIVYILTIFLTPVWLLWMEQPQYAPEMFHFLLVEKEAMLPVFLQLLLLEVLIDGLKLASLNTPDVLAGSLGIIGGLLVGEFAVSAGWFLAESILYMAFVVIAGFAQPSFEMGYAAHLSRIFLILLTTIFGLWGLIAGAAALVLYLAASRTVDGQGYLYPLLPFSARGFRKVFLRFRLRGDE